MPLGSEWHTNDSVLSCFSDQRINHCAQRENWWSLSKHSVFPLSSFANDVKADIECWRGMTNTWMIVKVLAAPATDVCLWERPAFKVILKASQRVFEFPRHWGTICPTCEERARTPLTKWLFSGAESYFYGSKGPVIHFPVYFFLNMAIPWKSNSSVTETEHEPCILWLSKPYSKCSVSASVRSCQLIPVSKEN